MPAFGSSVRSRSPMPLSASSSRGSAISLAEPSGSSRGRTFISPSPSSDTVLPRRSTPSARRWTTQLGRRGRIVLRPRRYRETRSVGMLVFDDTDGAARRLAAELHARLERLGVYERERAAVASAPHRRALPGAASPRCRGARASGRSVRPEPLSTIRCCGLPGRSTTSFTLFRCADVETVFI